MTAGYFGACEVKQTDIGLARPCFVVAPRGKKRRKRRSRAAEEAAADIFLRGLLLCRGVWWHDTFPPRAITPSRCMVGVPPPMWLWGPLSLSPAAARGRGRPPPARAPPMCTSDPWPGHAVSYSSILSFICVRVILCYSNMSVFQVLFLFIYIFSY